MKMNYNLVNHIFNDIKVSLDYSEQHYILRLLMKELKGDYECRVDHQKKVIDRLSRKIQRLKQITKRRSFSNTLAIKFITRISKAKHYIENNLSWAVGSEELIKILEGKDEK